MTTLMRLWIMPLLIHAHDIPTQGHLPPIDEVLLVMHGAKSWLQLDLLLDGEPAAPTPPSNPVS